MQYSYLILYTRLQRHSNDYTYFFDVQQCNNTILNTESKNISTVEPLFFAIYPKEIVRICSTEKELHIRHGCYKSIPSFETTVLAFSTSVSVALYFPQFRRIARPQNIGKAVGTALLSSLEAKIYALHFRFGGSHSRFNTSGLSHSIATSSVRLPDQFQCVGRHLRYDTSYFIMPYPPSSLLDC